MAYHQFPTQIAIKIKAVNFGAHFCLVSNPIAQTISKIPLKIIQKFCVPKIGGTSAWKTPGFIK